jgi:predicted nicotinamide N-methyase
MWRWRFMVSPSPTINHKERLNIVVSLTDEFGTEIDTDVARKLLDGSYVRCELLETESMTFISGQRAAIIQSPSRRCRWNFRPVANIAEGGSVVVNISCDCALDQLTVIALQSPPIMVRNKASDEQKVEFSHSFRILKFCDVTDGTGGGNNRISLKIREEFGANLGSHVWNSGIILSSYLADRGLRACCAFEPSVDMSGDRAPRVLELGSGCGVAAIVACLLGGDVVATDLPSVLPLLRNNVETNSLGMRSMVTATLAWDDFISASTPPQRHEDVGGRPFDIIIAADVLYSARYFEPLIRLIDSLSSARSVVLLAFSHRNFGPLVSEEIMRAADVPNRHPFFLLAAALHIPQHPETIDESQGKTGSSSPNMHLKRRWRSRSVSFTANIEIIEMLREA